LDLELWRAAYLAFLQDPDWSFLLPWARASGCLPIYCDSTHAFGLSADEQLILYEHDAPPGRPPETYAATDLRMQNLALIQGAERYPWLTALRPARPADAQDCSMCSGTGGVPEPFVCYCGGAGWVPADDTWVNKRRLER
jgi:hypothetical protein